MHRCEKQCQSAPAGYGYYVGSNGRYVCEPVAELVKNAMRYAYVDENATYRFSAKTNCYEAAGPDKQLAVATSDGQASTYYLCTSNCGTKSHFTARSQINNYRSTGYECRDGCTSGEKRVENNPFGSKLLYECVLDCPSDNAAEGLYFYY